MALAAYREIRRQFFHTQVRKADDVIRAGPTLGLDVVDGTHQ
jgi:hypothetical protein